MDISQLLYSVWVRHVCVRHATKNNPNPLGLIKIQEPRIGFGKSYFQRFNQWESRTLTLLKNFMTPFYGWGSTASRLQPLREDSLLFTIQFPEIPGTHFINLGRMKG